MISTLGALPRVRAVWPLLLVNWLLNATFAAGVAALGLVLLDLHPVAGLTLVLLLCLSPDALHIPELLVSRGPLLSALF